MKKLLIILFVSTSLSLLSQARLVFNNDGQLVMNNGVFLVLENGNSNAIMTMGTGGKLVSELEDNKIRWKIGSNTGSYTIPYADNASSGAGYGNNAYAADNGSKIPYTLTIVSAGTGGNGYIDFSTYDGPDWNNDTYRPSMVTHMQQLYAPGAVNHSDHAIDRFWIIQTNYTTQPTTSHVFGYIDDEITAVGNNLLEVNLGAQRFNDPAQLWGDMLPIKSGQNTAVNWLSTPNVAPSDFFAAWILSDITNPLPVEFSSFNVSCRNNGEVKIIWSTQSENNNSHFIIERSTDGIQFDEIGVVQGNGNSTQQIIYEYIDYDRIGLAYYRIRQVDFDGNSKTTKILNSNCIENQEPIVFENNNHFYIQMTSSKDDNVIFSLYDAAGRLVFIQDNNIHQGDNLIKINKVLETGVYFITISSSEIQQSVKAFMK